MFPADTEYRTLSIRKDLALLHLQLGDRLVGLMLPLVAQPLVEHKREDVVLVVLAGGLAPQDICGTPKVCFELLLSQPHVATP